jgi:hypothetical protein
MVTPAAANQLSQQLYRGVLHSIFAFLSLAELVSMSRITQSWYAAACHRKARGELLQDVSSSRMLRLVSSPLCRHISRLHADLSSNLSVGGVLLIHTHMPHLEDRAFSLMVRTDTLQRMVLPSGLEMQLQKLEMQLQTRVDLRDPLTDDARSIHVIIANLMNRLVSDRPLIDVKLTLLTIGGGDEDDDVMFQPFHVSALEPLRGPVTLTDLTMWIHTEDSHAVDLLRSMSQLRRFDLNGPPWTAAALDRLTRAECPLPQLQFSTLDSIGHITDSMAASLTRLSTLSQLTPSSIQCVDPGAELFDHLPQLTRIKIFVDRASTPIDIELACSGVNRLTRLTNLAWSDA